MQCPVCANPLRPVDRQGIEIDVCPQCRGVGLDRGELDKLLDRSAAYYGREDDDSGEYRAAGRRPEGYRPDESGYLGHPRKKKSFWREMFDFD